MQSQVKLHARELPGRRGLTFFILRSHIFGLFFLVVPALFPQTGTFDLERILRTNTIAGFREQVLAYIAKNKGTPLALFLDALSQTDAAIAVEKYRQLVTLYPNSDYAHRALMKSAQYYFSRGLYVAARKQFLELIETYAHSSYVDEAMYFAAACLDASGNNESATSELKNLIRQHPDSRFAGLAKEDLQESDSHSANGGSLNKQSALKMDHPNGAFSLQIGAFSQVNNALNLKNYCLKLGFPAEIREKDEGSSKMYLVWLGGFESKAEAERFGEVFKKEHGKPYRVVMR